MRRFVGVFVIILAWDVDGTLIDTSGAKPKNDKPYIERTAEENAAVFAAWERAIAENEYPPVPGAHSLMRGVYAMRDDWHTVVLTARRVALKDVTRAALEKHFPMLTRPPLLMRPDDDTRDSHVSKISRITEYRKQFPGVPLYVVDDDPKMEDACADKRDRFIFVGEYEWMRTRTESK